MRASLLLQTFATDNSRIFFILPVEHFSHFVKAAQGKQHQDGFWLMVDLWGAQMLCPSLQHVWTLCWVQTHLEKSTTNRVLKLPAALKVKILYAIILCILKLSLQIIIIKKHTNSIICICSMYSLITHIPTHSQTIQTLHSGWCLLLMEAVTLSYLGQPGGSVPLPVGLQVAAGVGRLVNQTQQLYSL